MEEGYVRQFGLLSFYYIGTYCNYGGKGVEQEIIIIDTLTPPPMSFNGITLKLKWV